MNVRGQLMSTAMLRYDEVEMAKKEASKDFSEEMKALRGRMRELSKNIRRKIAVMSWRSAMVVCSRSVFMFLQARGGDAWTRTDTGEIVKDEAMTSEEQQNNLFDDVQDTTTPTSCMLS